MPNLWQMPSPRTLISHSRRSRSSAGGVASLDSTIAEEIVFELEFIGKTSGNFDFRGASRIVDLGQDVCLNPSLAAVGVVGRASGEGPQAAPTLLGGEVAA